MLSGAHPREMFARAIHGWRGGTNDLERANVRSRASGTRTVAGDAATIEQARARGGLELAEAPSPADLAVLRSVRCRSVPTRDLRQLYISPNTATSHTRERYRAQALGLLEPGQSPR